MPCSYHGKNRGFYHLVGDSVSRGEGLGSKHHFALCIRYCPLWISFTAIDSLVSLPGNWPGNGLIPKIARLWEKKALEFFRVFILGITEDSDFVSAGHRCLEERQEQSTQNGIRRWEMALFFRRFALVFFDRNVSPTKLPKLFVFFQAASRIQLAEKAARIEMELRESNFYCELR